MQKQWLYNDIDSSVITTYNEINTTATLSALWVTRNHGGYFMSALLSSLVIHRYQISKQAIQ